LLLTCVAPGCGEREDQAAPDAAHANHAQIDAGAQPRAIERPAADDADGDKPLAPFHRRLRAVERREPGAMARIAVFSESTNASDFVTSELRRLLQARFGDGGKGWVPIAKGWGAHLHQDVEWSHSGWRPYIVNWGKAPLGRYGLGGVLFTSAGRGSWAMYGTARRGTAGRTVSRFRLFYLAWPGGGEVSLRLDDGEPDRLDTRADALEDRVHEVRASLGAHRLEMRSGDGEVRLYGVVMETDGPGVVVDALAYPGVSAGQLDHFDPEHLAAQVGLRETDLLVFWLGGADVGVRAFSREWILEHFGGAIRNMRRGRPEASCLVVSTLDRARARDGRVRSRPGVAGVVAAQEAVARAEGCGYFDLYGATGGEGTMERWSRSGPRYAAPDLTHLTAAGAAHVGALLHRELLRGYEAFLDPSDSIVGSDPSRMVRRR
jgi:lysophospholipase L1-like esterase